MVDGRAASMRIGSFTIIRPLGSGGMGSVSLARSDTDGQLVALKRLGSPEAHGWARLRRGAKAAHGLDHIGIAKTYVWGRSGNIYYVVGEYVDGKDLQQILAMIAGNDDPHPDFDQIWQSNGDGVPLDMEEDGGSTEEGAPEVEGDESVEFSSGSFITPQARRLIASEQYIRKCCEIALEIAVALHHAHVRGVIHRDIKPGNLMLSRDGRAKIIDFGAARYHGDATMTNTEAFIGTPAYMSPEQIIGDVKIDEKSDIFSFGIVLYEALTLDRPHHASSPFGVMAQIANRRIKPIRWKNAGITAKLESIIHKATALAPDDRYETAEALAEDLRHYLAGQPVIARPYRYELDIREIAARRPLRVLLSAVFFFFQAIIMMIMSPGVMLAPLDVEIGHGGKVVFLIMFAGVAVAFFVLGRGILVARLPAMILAPLVSLPFACFYAFTELMAFYLENYNLFMLIVVVFEVGMNLFITFSILTPKTIRWVKTSYAIRESYRKPASPG